MPELLDRHEALAAADALLSASGPRVLLVRGPAGIGKTTLLDALVARVGERTVLRGRGTPLEQGFALGLARQLLGTDAALGADLGLVLHTLFLDVSERAQHEPLLLVADDAHWADDVSLRLLAYLGRRLEGVDARLAIGTRTGDPGAEHEALVALAAEPSTRVVDLAPLGPGAVEEMVGSDLAEAARAATGGNPLLLGELLRALPQDAAPGDVEHAAIEQTVLARLLPLGDAPRAFAEAAAILGSGAPPHVAARLAGLDPDTAAEARDALVGAHIVAAGPSGRAPLASRPGEPTGLEFVHPLVEGAVVAALPPGRRAREHARAARLLAKAGARPDAVAAHLLQTEPEGDPWVVERLREAAASAVADGGTSEAARLLRRALDEPPAPDLLGAVLHEAGTAATRAGEPGGTELLAAALEHAGEPDDRIALVVELGLMASIEGRWDEVVPLYPGIALTVSDLEGPQQTVARARLLQLAMRHGPLMPEGLRMAATIDRSIEPAGAADRLLLGNVVEAMVLGDEPVGDTVALALRALGDDAAYDALIDWGTPLYPLLLQLAVCDAEADLAEQRLSHAIARAADRGSLVSRFLGLGARSVLRVYRGRLDEADADAAQATAIAEAGRGYDPLQPSVVRVEAALHRERYAEARQLLDAAIVRPLPSSILGWSVRVRRAALRLAEGAPAEALAEADAVGAELEAAGVKATAWIAWRPVAARAHRALDRAPEARILAATELDRARRFGAPRVVGEALRLSASLSPAPLPLLEEAVETLDRSEAAHVRARALVDLGAALRRANRRADAREPLAAGRELAHACGIDPLAERARQELLAAGARPRRIVRSGADALTPSELRTAHLAAAGATNREIAAELFVTVKTVEDHLSAAYRKLDVRGRAELAAKLPGRPPMRTGGA